jgi:hypothetical protein
MNPIRKLLAIMSLSACLVSSTCFGVEKIFTADASITPIKKNSSSKSFDEEKDFDNFITYDLHFVSQKIVEVSLHNSFVDGERDYTDFIIGVLIPGMPESSYSPILKAGILSPNSDNLDKYDFEYGILRTAFGAGVMYSGESAQASIEILNYIATESSDLTVDSEEFIFKPNSFQRLKVNHFKSISLISIKNELGIYNFNPATFETPMFDTTVEHDRLVYLKSGAGISFPEAKAYVHGGYIYLPKDPNYNNLLIMTGTQSLAGTHEGAFIELGVRL